MGTAQSNHFIMQKENIEISSLPKMINGKKASQIGRQQRLFILSQAISVYKNPIKALAGLKKLIELRNAVHGNERIKKYVESDGVYYWSTDYPGFPSNNFKKAIRNEFLKSKNGLDGANYIQTVIWSITNRCPLQCNHCYDWDNIDSKDKLSINQLQEILAKLENLGVNHIQLSGGEPLARFDDLVSIISSASDRVDFWILTSGFGLTLEKAIQLKQAGTIGLNISLDHWDREKHNQFRNNHSSFDWVVKAVEASIKAGLLVSLSLCATREFVTEDNLKEYTEFANSLGVHFVRILEPRSVGRFFGKKVNLDESQIKILENHCVEVNNLPNFQNYPTVKFIGYHQRKLGCMGAGNRYFYIDAHGDVHACPFCQGKQGNVFEANIEDILEKLRSIGCHLFNTNHSN
jgi:MoaA/NifB/PqqE/SkfB family radical SAM enzyme